MTTRRAAIYAKRFPCDTKICSSGSPYRPITALREIVPHRPRTTGRAVRERRNSGEIVLQRRRSERAPFHTEVTCLFGEVSFSAITMNLSTTGCFVETGTPVPLLAAVDVILHLSDDLAPAKIWTIVEDK